MQSKKQFKMNVKGREPGFYFTPIAHRHLQSLYIYIYALHFAPLRTTTHYRQTSTENHFALFALLMLCNFQQTITESSSPAGCRYTVPWICLKHAVNKRIYISVYILSVSRPRPHIFQIASHIESLMAKDEAYQKNNSK